MERTSERELVVTRTIDGPAHIVFDAWTEPELLKRWWVPRSVPITLLSCEMDVRVGAPTGSSSRSIPRPRWRSSAVPGGQPALAARLDERGGEGDCES